MLRYSVLLQKNAEVPGYWVLVPGLPGCFSQGRTIEEALQHAKEAIECHLEGLAQDGEELPVEQDPFIVASVMVEAPNVQEREVSGLQRRPVIRGYRISLSAVEEAVLRGYREGRIPELGGIRQYYIEVGGVVAPVKWVISEVTGMPLSEFITTESRRVLREVGFKVQKLDSEN